MALTYHVVNRVIRFDFEGETSTREIVDTFEAVFADPACPVEALVLLDVRGSTSLSARSSDNVRMLADFVSGFAERMGGRLAVVVEKPVQQGLTRMASVFAGRYGFDLQPFHAIEEALAWLEGTHPPAP